MEDRAWGIYQLVSKKEPRSIFNQEGPWLRASSSVESLNTPLASKQCFFLIAPALFRTATDVLSAAEKRKQTWLDSHLALEPPLFLFPTLVEYTTRTDRAELLSQGQAVCCFFFFLSPKPASGNNGHCVYCRNKGREFFQPLSRLCLVSCWGGNRMFIAPLQPTGSDWTKLALSSLRVLFKCWVS